jgi:hypothetical protein
MLGVLVTHRPWAGLVSLWAARGPMLPLAPYMTQHQQDPPPPPPPTHPTPSPRPPPQLRDRVRDLPEWKRRAAAKKILGHVSEAYGRMILGEGLFQADGAAHGAQLAPGCSCWCRGALLS